MIIGSLRIIAPLADLLVRLFQSLVLDSQLFDPGLVTSSLPQQVAVDSLVVDFSEPLNLFLEFDDLQLFIALLVCFLDWILSHKLLISPASEPRPFGNH